MRSAPLSLLLACRRVRRLTMPTFPGRLVLLIENGIETDGMIRFSAASALDEITLRFPLQLATSADRRAVVAGPGYPSVDEYRKFRRRARIVQRCAADVTPAQLLVAFVVVVPRYRSTEALLAYRQRRRQLREINRNLCQSKPLVYLFFFPKQVETIIMKINKKEVY